MRKYNFIIVILILLAISLDIVNNIVEIDITIGFLIQSLTRIVCIIIVLLLIKRLSIKVNEPKYKVLLTILFFVPAIVVSLLNFPLDSIIDKSIVFDIKTPKLITYTIFCLTVAISEELIFRGLFTNISYDKIDNSKYKVILRVIFVSLLFSLVHLLNIFTSDILSVLLQVGYTFIISIMLTTIYILTKNIYLCIVCHFIYNFVGMFTDYFSNSIYQSLMYIVWIVEGILVGTYILIILLKMTKKDNNIVIND